MWKGRGEILQNQLDWSFDRLDFYWGIQLPEVPFILGIFALRRWGLYSLDNEGYCTETSRISSCNRVLTPQINSINGAIIGPKADMEETKDEMSVFETAFGISVDLKAQKQSASDGSFIFPIRNIPTD
ncbi:14091_t:CDS:2 [Acaulospora colombiana]|uniref:14091_t:CDS:1 n=1 Tax=Acaulospora colombiana TaxID=27376 RepID=A0ACA9PXJ6_9GLOM|nr:14091_t:CDS:2 [Acaulospora colombiana]